MVYFPVIELRYPLDLAETVFDRKRKVENVKIERMRREIFFIREELRVEIIFQD